jgi:hypothetical protein
MSNFITIELCAEDRARIDRLIQALEKKTAQEEFSPVPTVLGDDPIRNALQRVLNNAEKGENKPSGVDETPTLPTTPNEEKTPTQEETEPTTPTRVIDRAELKALVIKLCAEGKKAESRNIILTYGATLGAIPEDKIAECYKKLKALEV